MSTAEDHPTSWRLSPAHPHTGNISPTINIINHSHTIEKKLQPLAANTVASLGGNRQPSSSRQPMHSSNASSRQACCKDPLTKRVLVSAGGECTKDSENVG